MGWKTEDVGCDAIYIEGIDIVGKQRARTVRHNGVTRSYTPKKTADFERAIREAWLSQVGLRRRNHTGPVHMEIRYGRELAKSNPKFWNGRLDTGKPDASNVTKAVEDALNGVAYVDDSQIFLTTCEKDVRQEHGSGNYIHVSVSYYEETYEKEQA